MSGKLLERLQDHQKRKSLATQQHPRQRSNPPLQFNLDHTSPPGQNDLDPPKSAAFFLRRNISEFRVDSQEMRKGGENAIFPKNALKQVSFLASPRGSTGNHSMNKRRDQINQVGVNSSLENASTALGVNMVKSPVFDRRVLKTRGSGNGAESFDQVGSQKQSSRGVFSSFSKVSIPLNNALSQLNFQDKDQANAGLLSPQPQQTSLQHQRGDFSARIPQDDSSQIWNRHTFTYTISRMRPKYKLSSKSGLQSDYLDRMQKNKIEKLSRLVDEEQNRVKIKREQLESLKTELEMMRLISGGQNEELSDSVQQETDKIHRVDLQESLRLAMLRPDLTNRGCQLTSFASSMNIHNNLTHQDITQSIQSPLNTISYLRTPALVSNAPNLQKSIYQPFYPMTFDDDEISANLQKIKQDLEARLKELEFKHKSEFFVYQKLDYQRIQERKEITSLTFRHRDLVPEQNRYEKAIEQVPLIKMLSDTAREQQNNLLSQRKMQLDKKKEFLQEILSKKVAQLKVHSKEIDALQGAIGKRQRRIDEMKEHLQELKENNREEDSKRKEMIAQLVNKNLEFKVLSGIEVIVKLEDALKAVDAQKIEQINIDDIKKVKQSAMNVDIISKQDLEVMNVKKIEKLKQYEKHFTQIFPNVEKISINDEFLQKRYEEISISIHSKTEKYQELVQTSYVKRKLIKQFMKLKNQVEQDRLFLASHLKQTSSLQDTIKSTTTLNDMRCAEFQIKSGLIDQDHQYKKQIIAQAFTFVNTLLGRYSYILREIFQIIRFEHTLPGTERDGPQQISMNEYFQSNFLALIQKCASKFALEHLNQNFGETSQSSFDRKAYTTKDQLFGSTIRSAIVSPNKLKKMETNLNGSSKFPNKSSKQIYQSQMNMNAAISGHKQNFNLRHSQTVRARFMDSESMPTFAIHVETEEDGNFDLTILEDLKYFLDYVVNKREPQRLIEALEITKHEREFQHKYALNYIKSHPVINRICDYCKVTQEMGIDDATILINGLDFKAKNPKLKTREILQIENEEIKVSRRIAGNKDLHEDFIQEFDESDSSDQIPEEDYVDPDTKHIITDILIADKKRIDTEARRKKREKEREKLLKKMSDAERREQNKIKLQRQIAALQLYQKDEHSFRAQFKNNLADVFNNDLPKEKETRQYLILDGQALAAMANTTLKNQKDPYKHYPNKLPENIVGITSQPDLQRTMHKNDHHRVVMSSQSLRTQSLKGQLKRQKTLQSTANEDINQGEENEPMMSMAAMNAEPPKGMSAAAAFKKLQAQRLLERQLQRRSVVKINKPSERQGNIVLQMLQDKFPELEKLFMDTTQRRNQRINQLNQLKSAGASLLSSPTSPSTVDQQLLGYSPMIGRKGNSSGNLTNCFVTTGMDEDTTNLANTAGGYNSDDQMTANAAGVPGPVSGFVYHTQEDEDTISLVEPIIKVKPVYPRGVFK